jgi:hypothetical protein
MTSRLPAERCFLHSGMSMKFLAALFLFLLVPFANAEPSTLVVGRTTIQLPVAVGYVRVSQADPALMATEVAAVAQQNTFLEALITTGDLQRRQQHAGRRDAFFTIGIAKVNEHARASLAEWNQLKAAIPEHLGAVDLKKVAEAGKKRVDEAVSAEKGRQVDVSQQAAGSLVDYRDTPTSVAFSTVVHSRATIDGKVRDTVQVSAIAYALVRNKVLMVCAYYPVASGWPDAATVAVRARLDAFVDALVASNPSDPKQPSARD